jgi:hypothetical protein
MDGTYEQIPDEVITGTELEDIVWGKAGVSILSKNPDNDPANMYCLDQYVPETGWTATKVWCRLISKEDDVWSSISLSPDNNNLAICLDNMSANTATLAIVNVGDRKLSETSIDVADIQYIQPGSFVWSPDGKYLAFWGKTGSIEHKYYIVPVDGSIQPQLVYSGDFPVFNDHGEYKNKNTYLIGWMK